MHKLAQPHTTVYHSLPSYVAVLGGLHLQSASRTSSTAKIPISVSGRDDIFVSERSIATAVEVVGVARQQDALERVIWVGVGAPLSRYRASCVWGA
jgi:hypothetical protein